MAIKVHERIYLQKALELLGLDLQCVDNAPEKCCDLPANKKKLAVFENIVGVTLKPIFQYRFLMIDMAMGLELFRISSHLVASSPPLLKPIKATTILTQGDSATITVLKSNKPLCLRIHRQNRMVLYASEAAFIDFAVDNEKDWRKLEVPPMTILTIRHEDVRTITNSEFRFIPQERKRTLPYEVNA